MTKETDPKRALVLFSGGQDSTVCLGWALSQFVEVYTIGIDYGQRHRAELECRERILRRIVGVRQWEGDLVDDVVLPMPFFATIGDNALIAERTISKEVTGLPNTFVPARNIIFLTAAAAHAYTFGIGTLVAGMSEVDYSGYPDCRRATMDALEYTLRLSMEAKFAIATPLIHKDKAATWHMARELGGEEFLEMVRTETHTCYVNDRSVLHSWGYGCGECPACVLRKTGYEKAFAST